MPEQPSIIESALADLGRAKRLLETPGFIAKAADAVGTPMEKLLHALPEKASTAIQTATKTALEKALKVAVATLGEESGHEPSNIWHKLAVVATGAAGGAFGLASLPIELPVSTIIMLRSVADIARSRGENMSTPDAALALLGRIEHCSVMELTLPKPLDERLSRQDAAVASEDHRPAVHPLGHLRADRRHRRRVQRNRHLLPVRAR